MSRTYYCKKCETDDATKFYKSNTSRCKSCTKSVSTGTDRNPATATTLECLGCKTVFSNPKDVFLISVSTGLYLDKCKVCKHISPSPGENSPKRPEPTPTLTPSIPPPQLFITVTVPTDPIIRGTAHFIPSRDANGAIIYESPEILRRYQELYIWAKTLFPIPSQSEYRMLETIFRRLANEYHPLPTPVP